MINEKSPFFSVIVPVFNRQSFIIPLIRSVLAQVNQDFELIIVNDGCTDETEKRIREIEDPRIVYLRIENSERGAARNAGAAIARGIYFNFFDSDDVMLPHHLSTAFDFIRRNQQTSWFHVGFETCDEQGNLISRELGVADDPERKLIKTNYLGCDSVFVHRDVFLSTRFNEDRKMASSEDWELWLRIISRVPLHVCPVVTLKMTHHPNRSLLTISADRIIERDLIMLRALLADESFRSRFKNDLALFEADRYTFFALCLIIERRKQEGFQYLWKSFRRTPLVVKRRRFWACLKMIVIG
jgi:glycosyltransferase involved in cell wall biosynthesis